MRVHGCWVGASVRGNHVLLLLLLNSVMYTYLPFSFWYRFLVLIVMEINGLHAVYSINCLSLYQNIHPQSVVNFVYTYIITRRFCVSFFRAGL